MSFRDLDPWHMRRALELAAEGEGYVEPNPMVGCVIAQGAETLGEGWHRRFGGPHAEIEALRIAGPRAAGATMFVTLEPCCHFGKTPPCTRAVVDAGIRRVVVAIGDPFPAVAGGGLAELRAAGIETTIGVLEAEAAELVAPYLKLLRTGLPWVIAKWAMTLDGKIATHTGVSRWISGPESRAVVHRLRGRVDAIVVGRQTAAIDDPQLTARPPGPRTPLRIVVDSRASLSPSSQLAQSAGDTPVMVAVADDAPREAVARLQDLGCEVFPCRGSSPCDRIRSLLVELGRRRMTNVLVEGGGQLLGTLFDGGWIDEVHAFIAPKLIGGAAAPAPFAGMGIGQMDGAKKLRSIHLERCGEDVYLRGRVDVRLPSR